MNVRLGNRFRAVFSALLLAGLAAALYLGCRGSKQSGWPDPYAGFTHSKPEHGYWKQISAGGQPPDKCIEELHLHDRGFSVTWSPFETYKDYWGTYRLKAEDGAVVFVAESGNYIPADFSGAGRLVLESPDRLRLEGVWLGSASTGAVKRMPVLLFARFEPVKH